MFHFLMTLALSFVFLSYSPKAYARIEECSSLQQILLLTNTQRSQLLIFDIDNTLIHPKQMLGSDEWFDFFLQKQQALYGNDPQILRSVIDLWTAIQIVTDVIPVEQETPILIQKLQKENRILMGMTTRGSALATATFRQLGSLAIDLSKTAPTQVRFQLHRMPDVHYGKGILFTDGYDKGKALKEFLCQIQWTPESIVYINDKKAPLEEVEASLPETIHFIGLRYSGSDHFIKELSQPIVEAELDHFTFLLPDREAALYQLQ